MGKDIVQATYDQLEEISGRFNNESQSMEQMMSSIKNSMDALKSNWIGKGSDAFFAEMEGEMLPAGQRLIAALNEGSAVTREISSSIQQAEEEASGPFKSWAI